MSEEENSIGPPGGPCPNCGAEQSRREDVYAHPPCGYVAMPGSAGDLDVCPDCRPAFGSGERLHRVGSVSECVDCGYRFTGVRETAPPERSEERSVGRPSVVEHVAVAVFLAIRLGGGNRLPLFAPLFVVGYETIVDGILL